MLSNTSDIVSIIAQLVAVLIALGGPLIALWLRVRTLEVTVAQQGERLKGVDSLGERLARIETLLEILIKERGHGT